MLFLRHSAQFIGEQVGGAQIYLRKSELNITVKMRQDLGD